MDEGAEPPQASADEATVASGVELVSLKDGLTFLVGDHNGDLIGGADGLFDRDTRVLSRLVFLIGDRHPTRLSSTLSRDNAVFTFHGTNRTLPPVNGRGTPRGAIHIERRRTLAGERLFERVRCTNFGLDQVMLPLVFEYAADFRDMFEVRGARGAARCGRRSCWAAASSSPTRAWMRCCACRRSPSPSRPGGWTSAAPSS